MGVVVIGAGIGGLTTAALLAHDGMKVEVLEAHTDPGGCAATFADRGFRFDAGATLAAGFAPGMPTAILGERLGISWGTHPEPLAMQVHLPDGTTISRWTDRERWQAERRAHFGEGGERFWTWQEQTAQALWDLAQGGLPWPPQDAGEGWALFRRATAWLRQHPRTWGSLIQDAFRPVGARLPDGGRLRLFVDAQLIISAQASAAQANALYGAIALDLPHTGVGTMPGGIGAIAERLVEAVQRAGGRVCFGQEVRRVRRFGPHTFRVETGDGEAVEAEGVIFNMPPPNAAILLRDEAPSALRRLLEVPSDGWGAFMAYLGVPEHLIPPSLPLHHQILTGHELVEGGMIFLTLSPPWDPTRAPPGFRCVTISTHTDLASWWEALARGPQAYAARKAELTKRVLQAARRLLPELPVAEAEWPEGWVLRTATPVTFHQFTRRARGWVAGFPQTSLWRYVSPRLAPGLWLVGDTIFPGPSIPAVILGAIRVTQQVQRAAASTGRRPLRNRPVYRSQRSGGSI
ncbi:MAG: FAD-dependent oxidoreductase [Thermoflexus sp.]|jgi:C-3',4' desaturase CrtD|nr:FAD-dependent oxidoreductase [Thermoflexus sp.]